MIYIIHVFYIFLCVIKYPVIVKLSPKFDLRKLKKYVLRVTTGNFRM
jgi:hypothetical protein